MCRRCQHQEIAPMRFDARMHQAVMTSENARAVAMTCDRCQSKMQSIADLLLISCDARPVNNDHLRSVSKSHSGCREHIFDLLEQSVNLFKEITTHIGNTASKWRDISNGINDLSEFIVKLVESCGHIAYLTAINFPDCSPSQVGVVDKYTVSRANLDIRMCCTRLRRSRMEDLSSQFLVDICSNISKALSIMTDVCRYAGEHAPDTSDQEQFKLCVKSITSSTSCLIASIKCFKSHPTSQHLNRVIAFCDPVMAASTALVTLASEDGFIGMPASLTPDAKETQKSILGACMSIVSGAIQLCRFMRDLVYDTSNLHHRERIRLCSESMDKASSHLQELLSSYSVEDTASDALSTSSSMSSTSSR